MQHISDLLYKYATGSLSENEKAELEAWVEARPERRIFLERLASPQWLETDYHRQKAIDVEKAISEMKTRISLADNSELKTDRYDSSQESDSNSKTAHTSRFAILNSHLYRVAAVLVLLLVGGTFWYREHTRVTPPTISEEIQLAMEQSRITGRQAAEVINGDEQTKVITRQELTRYHVDEHFAEQMAEAKRITTYQDKEFWVTLDDGTLVHLNNNSRLIYPERFGDRRDVILDGEAYFMVAKDKSRQFVVHTPQGDIRVYGTEFWVNTRVLSDKLQVASEKHDYSQGSGSSSEANRTSHLSPATSQLILVRGSVSFTPTEGDEQMLRPGQQLSVVNSQLAIKDVDTTPYEAWNTGLFVFENTTLEHLLSVMAQWYDIKAVNYTNDSLRKIHFTGNLKRYGSAERIMKAIMMACEVKIVLQNDTLLVSN